VRDAAVQGSEACRALQLRVQQSLRLHDEDIVYHASKFG